MTLGDAESKGSLACLAQRTSNLIASAEQSARTLMTNGGSKMADTRRRLRSGTVVLGGMGLLAAALTACSSEPDKRCVDRDSYTSLKGYKVIADKNCKTTKSVKTTKTGTTKTSVSSGWYYGGKKKGGWVDGGSFTKASKGSGSSTSGGSHHSVDRGGFGSGKGSSGG